MDFSLPVSQRTIFRHWEQFVRNQKIPHAVLMSGAAGSGKFRLIKAMLQLVLCETQSACGECRSCHWLSQNAHPDCLWLAPEALGKAIKIDTIRAATAWLQLSPLHAAKKFLIIQSAENLNVAASNALLKTLEEPPETSIIILISELPQQLLATVRSRCYKMVVPSSAASAVKNEEQEKTWQVFEEVFYKKIHFLVGAEKLKEVPPTEVLACAYDFMLHQVQEKNLERKWFEFETLWLTLKRSLLNGANLNWQLQVELMLEKLASDSIISRASH